MWLLSWKQPMNLTKTQTFDVTRTKLSSSVQTHAEPKSEHFSLRIFKAMREYVRASLEVWYN